MQELTTWIRIAATAGLVSGCGATAPSTAMAPVTTTSPTGGVPAQETPRQQAPDASMMQKPPTTEGGSKAPDPLTPTQSNGSMAAGTGGGGAGRAGGNAGAPAAGGGQAMAPTGACDRPCLIEVLSTYLTALTKKDPAGAKFSTDVRFTENGMERKIGEGLWQMASGVRDGTRLDFADPVTGQVGSQLVVETGSSAVAYNLRLKVVEGSITEVESVVAGASAPVPVVFTGLVPDPIFTQAIDPAKRATRDELLKSAQAYEKLLETGSATMAGVKFHPEMVRLENGRETANAMSLSARESGAGQGDIPSRFPLIDEEYGLVFGVFQFANTLVPNELFKIMDGQIRLLNIVINAQPSDGWD